MSPENCSVFLAFERGDFSKNSGILQLIKMGLLILKTNSLVKRPVRRFKLEDKGSI